MEKWKKNLYMIFFAEMIAITGFAFIAPFLPLYIKELGITDLNQVARWSGFLMTAPALVMVIISPVWGLIADKVGRKPMIERAIFGSGITIFLMSWVGNIYQLLLLRLMQGFLTGTVAACTALISASSPRNKMGYSLGLLQTSVFLGNFIGPLIGGISADIFGFKNSFRITGFLLLIAGCLIWFFVEEKFTPHSCQKKDVANKENISFIFHNISILAMIIVLFFIQFSVSAITPIFSLFVETIASQIKNIPTIVGIMFALTGLTSAISAVNIGRLTEKKPIKKILFISLIGVSISFLLHGFAINISQLFLLRILLGFFYGSIIPITSTIISLSTPYQHKGKVFGITNSLTCLGNILGPITGGFIMVTFNISSVFLFTGSINMLVVLILFLILKNKIIDYNEVCEEDRKVSIKRIVGSHIN